MEVLLKQCLRSLFISCCVLIAISICGYWVYKFRLDEDLSVITYREFFEREYDIHPTVSLCIKNPFLGQRLAENGVNQSSYLDFLKGNDYSEEMLNIKFDDTTIDISDYVKGYRLYFRNGSRIDYNSQLNREQIKKLIYVSYNGVQDFDGGFHKCFALDIPRIPNLLIVRILLSNNIFPSGKRPMFGGLRVIYHLPQQFLLADTNQKWEWSFRAANESYKMRFQIGGNTIMRKRNKRVNKCIASHVQYDDWFMHRYRIQSRCNLPYGKQDQMLPVCNTKELIKGGLLYLGVVERSKLDRPCKTMTSIDVDHLEGRIETSKTKQVGEFWFSIMFKQRGFTEIGQIRYIVIFFSYQTLIIATDYSMYFFI